MWSHSRVVVGPFQCNCQVIACKTTGHIAVIDPGDDSVAIQRVIDQQKALQGQDTDTGRHLWLIHTHAHLDHVGATRKIAEWYRQKQWTVHVALHPDDQPMYAQLKMQGQMFGMPQDDPTAVTHWLSHGETLEIGSIRFEVLHTPGHSPGGVCYRLGEEMLFSGDTLFDHSVGRTDLWEGDWSQLSKSIRERIFTLDDDTVVIPGHGGDTKVGIEKRENPYVSQTHAVST